MSIPIERLAGPATTVTWTPDRIRASDRERVVLVREKDLVALEAFFTKPLHQQVAICKDALQEYLKVAPLPQKQYPNSVFLFNAARALETAEALLFADFTSHLTVTEVIQQ